MKFRKYFTLLLVFAASRLSAQSASQYLKIGDKMPDVIFNHVKNFKSGRIHLSDYKGKLIIIDFWAVWCSSCIRAFPALDSLQQDFKDELLILPVTTEKEEKVNDLMKRIPSLKNLALPWATDDTTIRKRFEQVGLPLDIVVDGNGIIKAITDVEGLNKNTIGHYLRGDSVTVEKRAPNPHVDFDAPLFIDDKGEVIQRHFLQASYLPGALSIHKVDKLYGSKTNNHFSGVNQTLAAIFQIAGAHRAEGDMYLADNRMKLRVQDTSRFLYPSPDRHSWDTVMKWCRENCYCIDVIVPPGDTDLFAYFKSELEYSFRCNIELKTEVTDCYALTTLDSNIFKTKAKSPMERVIFDRAKSFWSGHNTSIFTLNYWLNYYSRIPIIDETGYIKRIDFANFKPIINNYQLLKSELNKIGFDLLPAKRNIEILEISDAAAN